MEEKERYEFGQRTLFNNREELTTFDGFNLDDFMQIICKLLNQQDKENQQLKQQLHDLPKKIVEEIRKWGQKHYNWVGDGTGYDGQDYNECIGFNMAIDQLNEILDTILKKYGVENE